MVNLARAGATSTETLHTLQTYLEQHDGPVADGRLAVVMTVGGNDFKNAIWQELLSGDGVRVKQAADRALVETMHNLGAIVKLLRDPRRTPFGCNIYFANVYDATDGQEQVATPYGVLPVSGVAEALRHWDRAFASFADRAEVTLINAHAAFTHHGMQASPAEEVWFEDPIHPNDIGHHQLRALFWRAMERDLALGSGQRLILQKS